ncbi:MAG: hypothetical protein K8R74_00020, partial [Bacteroidales bacterium]|nr:hypothetical protein [Bacteroidales bacterium]
SYIWHHGCGPTSLGMIIGYYDGHGFPDLIDGDASTQITDVDDAIANTEHYNDYSLPIDTPPDPPISDLSETGGAHTSNCIADFMKTSWSSEDNYYGLSWAVDVGPAFIDYVSMRNSSYNPTSSIEDYSEITSWILYRNEIDNNRPVNIVVDSDGNGIIDHQVTGIGYDDIMEEFAVFNTWDNDIHWYEWRGVSAGDVWGVAGFISVGIDITECFSMELKVLLEGPFNGSDMNNDLNTFLPLNQPYNTSPWNYNGSETLIEIPVDAVDWVLIEMYDADNVNDINELTQLGKRAALLYKNGQIRDANGSSLLDINGSILNNLYVKISHRNHLDIVTSSALIKSGSTYSYDFTDVESKTLGGSKSHKYLGNGVWGMITADGNVDNQVNNQDKDDIWYFQLNTTGYLSGDFNLDGEVDEIDYNYWESNTGYGEQVSEDISFTCGYELLDNRDGQSYPTVSIGDQCWMAKNLNIGVVINGSIPQTYNGLIEKHCYNNEIAACDMYGGMYQWDEMMGYSGYPGVQGICPNGWHLPTNNDWNTLTDYLGGLDIAGAKLKEIGTEHWQAPNTGATNESGFTALPGGLNGIGNFVWVRIGGWFWSESTTPTTASYRAVTSGLNTVFVINQTKASSLSVRCLKE